MATQDLLMAADSGEGGGAGTSSIWSQIGGFLGDNKDLLLAGAMELAKYQKQQAEAQAQNIINQAASKWSGFNPNLMQMVKPVQQPDIAESILSAAVKGPAAWSKLAELYEARKQGPQNLSDFLKKNEQQKAINAGLASGNIVAQQAAQAGGQ